MAAKSKSLFLSAVLLLITYLLDLNKSKYFYDTAGFQFRVTDPEIHLTTTGIIERMGYSSETHEIETADGYILEFHRIPPRHLMTSASKGPILLLHGTHSSSVIWVINFPNQSLGYILHDAGYDVWLANLRGSPYSRRHRTLSPEEDEFWNFSWDEMSLYDVPAAIDYILKETNTSSIGLIGNSMGGIVHIATLALKPEYNKKVKIVISLCPATAMQHMKWFPSLVLTLAQRTGLISLGATHVYLFDMLHAVSQVVCTGFLGAACVTLYEQVFGTQGHQLNMTRLPVYVAHYPVSGAPGPLNHFAQMQSSNAGITRYDFGASNILRYSQQSPPKLDLSEVTAPTVIYYSEGDFVSTEKDVKHLASQLPNLIGVFSVEKQPFSHMDFVLGLEAYDLYARLINVLDRF